MRGLVVSLNTPFDNKDRVDWASLERLVEMHLDEGAVGFLVAAQAGEVHSLSLEERMQLLRVVREQTRERAEVIAGATAKDNAMRFRVAEEAVKMGCDGVLVEPPSELMGKVKQLADFFRSFAGVGMPMLMIQDLDWHGVGMAVSLINELFSEIESFRCLKIETTPAGPKYTQVIDATQGKLHVSGGWASQQMIEALDRGVDVFMNTGMTRWYRRVFDAYQDGRREMAIGFFHQILPVLAFTRQHLDVSIQFYKRLFHHRGIFSTSRSRQRSVPYDAYYERYGAELIAYLDRLDGIQGTPHPV